MGSIIERVGSVAIRAAQESQRAMISGVYVRICDLQAPLRVMF